MTRTRNIVWITAFFLLSLSVLSAPMLAQGDNGVSSNGATTPAPGPTVTEPPASDPSTEPAYDPIIAQSGVPVDAPPSEPAPGETSTDGSTPSKPVVVAEPPSGAEPSSGETVTPEAPLHPHGDGEMHTTTTEEQEDGQSATNELEEMFSCSPTKDCPASGLTCENGRCVYPGMSNLDPGQPCSSSNLIGKCESGQVCFFGECTTLAAVRCSTTQPCAGDRQCFASYCIPPTRPSTGGQEEPDGDGQTQTPVGIGEVCTIGGAACANNGQCVAASSTAGTQGQCVTGIPGATSCFPSCSSGQTCVSGMCIAPGTESGDPAAGSLGGDCVNGNTCNSGMQCLQNKCIPKAIVINEDGAQISAAAVSTSSMLMLLAAATIARHAALLIPH